MASRAKSPLFNKCQHPTNQPEPRPSPSARPSRRRDESAKPKMFNEVESEPELASSSKCHIFHFFLQQTQPEIQLKIQPNIPAAGLRDAILLNLASDHVRTGGAELTIGSGDVLSAASDRFRFPQDPKPGPHHTERTRPSERISKIIQKPTKALRRMTLHSRNGFSTKRRYRSKDFESETISDCKSSFRCRIPAFSRHHRG